MIGTQVQITKKLRDSMEPDVYPRVVRLMGEAMMQSGLCESSYLDEDLFITLLIGNKKETEALKYSTLKSQTGIDMKDLEIKEGDLFYRDIEYALKEGCKVYGEKWGLWGKWVYCDNKLVGLFSRTYGTNAKSRAYAIKKDYEWIIPLCKWN